MTLNSPPKENVIEISSIQEDEASMLFESDNENNNCQKINDKNNKCMMNLSNTMEI